jgi:ER-bound oxygenase mpaB/B'/Rubber oxygenase, catalytic domain
LLVKTSQLSTLENAGKRYADTAALVAEIFGNEPTSERVIEAFGRLNYLHGVYRASGQILDDDMLYTLALFAIEPIRWIERYDWRKLTDLEKCAVGTFMKSMGDAMLIDYGNLPSAKHGFKDGIQWLEEIWQWIEEYEIKHMVPNKDNHQTANETTALLLFNLPDALKPIGRSAVSALMDDRLRDAMMFVRQMLVRFIADALQIPYPSSNIFTSP